MSLFFFDDLFDDFWLFNFPKGTLIEFNIAIRSQTYKQDRGLINYQMGSRIIYFDNNSFRKWFALPELTLVGRACGKSGTFLEAQLPVVVVCKCPDA